jgi:uncharacterized protein (TIGR00255 family)
MTGFASVGREDAGDRVNVSVKSVNHRFLDISLKAPSLLAAGEHRLRALVQQRVTRGRIEIAIQVEAAARPMRDVVLDEDLVARVAGLLEAARARGVVTGGLTASDVLRIPQAIEIRARPADAATADAAAPAAVLAETALADALDALVIMRETEGRFLAADLDARLTTLGGFADEVEREARAGQDALAGRLRDRLAALPPDLAGDPAAMAQEILRVVARSDIDEELVRLRGHVTHWRMLAAGPEPCGRKLEFLAQEMNREVNTIGSKVESQRATGLVVAAKAELERVREQVQNVE